MVRRGRQTSASSLKKKWQCVSQARLLILLTRNVRNTGKPFWKYAGEVESKGSWSAFLFWPAPQRIDFTHRSCMVTGQLLCVLVNFLKQNNLTSVDRWGAGSPWKHNSGHRLGREPALCVSVARGSWHCCWPGPRLNLHPSRASLMGNAYSRACPAELALPHRLFLMRPTSPLPSTSLGPREASWTPNYILISDSCESNLHQALSVNVKGKKSKENV